MSAPEIIWLFETPRWAWADDTLGIEWDSEDERFVDGAGEEVSLGRVVALGAGAEYFETSTAFDTEKEARDWGRCKSYNYPDGFQIRGVPIEWGPETPHPGRTHEVLRRDGTRDPIFLGQTRHDLPDGADRWATERVFLTRIDGDVWRQGRGLAPFAPTSDRVYCVPAEWSLCDLLAARTVGGRYS